MPPRWPALSARRGPPPRPPARSPTPTRWRTSSHGSTGQICCSPDWGPYSTRFAGVSHVADAERGLRFDLTVAPGFYRRKVLVPNALWESGYHPWTALPSLDRYSYRYRLQGHDDVTADAAFVRVDDQTRLVEVAWTNRTAIPQSLALHLVASLEYPADDGAEAVLPPGAVWTDGVDYSRLDFARPNPRDSLTYDGWRRGEARGAAFVGGRALARVGREMAFGCEAGDRVGYRLRVGRALGDAHLVVRARARGGAARFDVGGLAGAREVVVPPSDTLATVRVPLGRLAAGDHAVTLTSLGGASVEIDGLAVVGAGEAVSFRARPRAYEPEVTPGPVPGSVVLRYPDLDHVYGIAWGRRGVRAARVRRVGPGDAHPGEHQHALDRPL